MKSDIGLNLNLARKVSETQACDSVSSDEHRNLKFWQGCETIWNSKHVLHTSEVLVAMVQIQQE